MQSAELSMHYRPDCISVYLDVRVLQSVSLYKNFGTHLHWIYSRPTLNWYHKGKPIKQTNEYFRILIIVIIIITLKFVPRACQCELFLALAELRTPWAPSGFKGQFVINLGLLSLLSRLIY